MLCIHMYRCTSDIPLLHGKKQKQNNKKQNQCEPQTPYELAFVFICVFLLVLGLWGWVGQGCSFFWDFWFRGGSRTARRLNGLSWCADGTAAEPNQNQKKQKPKTLRRLLGLDSKDCYFGFPSVFWFWSQKTKNTRYFVGFSRFMVGGSHQKNKKHQVFFGLLEFETKKHKENHKKKHFLNLNQKVSLKFCFFGCPCVFWFWCFFFLNNSKLSPTQNFLQQTLVFQ